jgi:hypothetical protein
VPHGGFAPGRQLVDPFTCAVVVVVDAAATATADVVPVLVVNPIVVVVDAPPGLEGGLN